MRARRFGFIASFLLVAYVSIAGCGDDDSSVMDVADTGTDTGIDGSSTRPDTSTSTPDTSVADTSVADQSVSDATNDARSPEYTGSACMVAADCYQGFDAQALKGAPYCIDKVTNGYCTHECQTDDDCCAVTGECKTTLKQVCAPFENTGKKVCVLSCEDADIRAGNDAGTTDAGLTDAGGTNGDDYCHKNTSTEFGCRSTGGGAANRKACLPTATTTPSDAGSDADASSSDASDAGLDANLDAALDADGG